MSKDSVVLVASNRKAISDDVYCNVFFGDIYRDIIIMWTICWPIQDTMFEEIMQNAGNLLTCVTKVWVLTPCIHLIILLL